jgi:putative membrane protein
MDETSQSKQELRRETSEVRRSTRAVEQSIGRFADSADRRTELAGDRTLLSAERTYAAWMRTALAALAGGVGARALVKGVLPLWIGRVSGTILVLFAAFCLVAAVWRELHGITQVRHPDVRPIPLWLLVSINLLLLLVVAAAIVGIWSGSA